MMRHSLYHKILRVSAVLVAVVLVFQSGVFLSGTEGLSLSTREYVANVIGISASIESTELNTMTAEFTKRMQELDEREREINARAEGGGSRVDYSDYILSTILFLLLILIVTNYVLDFVRARSGQKIDYATMG